MVDHLQQPKLVKQVSQKIKISIDEVLEKYDCPICMCKLNEPFITKCGHTFCKVFYTHYHNMVHLDVHIRMCEQTA